MNRTTMLVAARLRPSMLGHRARLPGSCRDELSHGPARLVRMRNVIPLSLFPGYLLRQFKPSSSLASELKASLSRLKVSASAADFYEKKSRKIFLHEGLVIEFTKDSGEISVGITQSREGKRNWNVLDQNAETCIVRPKQINVVVPGAENFTPKDLSDLVHQVEILQDPRRLEVAWEEMVMSSKAVDLEELALVLYGGSTPEKCYSAYRLLVSHPVYFERKEDGYSPLYEARSLEQVRQLRLQQLGEEIAQKKILEFANMVKSAMQLPHEEKPRRTSWDSRDEIKNQLDSLKAFALEMCKSDHGKRTAYQILDALMVPRTPATALNLLIKMGYFAMHENFELLKMDLPIEFSKEAEESVIALKTSPPVDLDKDTRVDLTSLKVFTIDTDSPKEIDDGLSAVKLEDGRFKVWIHVADPTRWVNWNNILRKEASQRSTSIYLPTMTIPMFPMEVATDFMSLQQGQTCPAISISAVLSHDGSVEEANIENSMICPACNLSYDAANDLLSKDVDKESELSILCQAAMLRNKWRLSNGASNVCIPKAKVQVEGEETIYPKITVTLDDDSSRSAILVSEMMILCGEIIARYGGEKGIPLPYRSQSHNEEINKQLEFIPEGPARSIALLTSASRADTNFFKPLPHALLGLTGYVQFTSPIRRYTDLLAHFQIKAALRGQNPPLLPGYLEASMLSVNTGCRTAKKLQLDAERYWILEYLRRQPRNKIYRACVLRFVRDTVAVILLMEVGIQSRMDLLTKKQIGEELYVCINDSQPRRNHLLLREVQKA